MFTIKKLLSLPYKTRMRKLVLILQKAEMDLACGSPVDAVYIISLVETIRDRAGAFLVEAIAAATRCGKPGIRELNRIRHAVLQQLGAEPTEWDFIVPGTGVLDKEKRRVFPARIFLEDLRSPFNVGSIFRTAECFGAEHIYLSGSTPLPTHKKAAKTSRGAEQILPWTVCSLEEVQDQPAVFALETGGIPAAEFRFPAAGVVLIGSEELGLSPEALHLADHSAGRVGIPLLGAKRSLNVSVAFGILMEHWSRHLLPVHENGHYSTL